MNRSDEPRPPFPPFDAATAAQKVRMAEDAWNSRDPVKVSLAYTSDSVWRNRAEFIRGRDEIVQFLERKWAKELDYSRPLAFSRSNGFRESPPEEITYVQLASPQREPSAVEPVPLSPQDYQHIPPLTL